MPSLLQNMVGFSEVARATQTDPRPQHPAPPQPQAATMPWSQPGSWARRGPVLAWSQPPAPQPAEAGQAVLPGALGRTYPAPAAFVQAPSTGQLFPLHSGVVASSLCSVWDFGAQSHIPRPVAALSRPLAVFTSGKAALYTPTASCLHSPPCAVVGPQHPRLEEQMVCSLPAPLLGMSRGTALEAPPSHPPVLWVSFLWRLLAGWLGPSSPRPPSFYLCWCLQFGVGSLGRQLHPVLAERCCLSLCGWTRPSLAPPRTL